MKTLVTLLALISTLPRAAEGGQLSDGIEIFYAVQRPVLVLREPMVVQFTIQNRRSEAVEFNLGGDYKQFFRIRLTRPDGKRSEELAPFSRGGVAEIGRVSLGPNEEFSHQVVLPVTLGLDQLGDYAAELRIESVFPFRTRSGANLKPPIPGLVRFRIEPRNEERLRQACAEAADTALNAGRGHERSEHMKAVRYLAELVDPVAVPCLQRVIERVELNDDDLFRTLARIGTPEARAALQALQKSSDKSKATRAGARLRELATGRPIFN